MTKNIQMKYSRFQNKIFISRLNNHPGEMLQIYKYSFLL